MVAVDPRSRKIPLRCSATGLVTVDNRHYLELTVRHVALNVDGCVSLSSNEAVTDKGAT